MKRVFSFLLALIVLVALIPGNTAHAANDNRIALGVDTWTNTYSWNNTARLSKEKDTIIIDNRQEDHSGYYQVVSVKPNTDYVIYASVRIENYEEGSEGPGGVTVGYGEPFGEGAYECNYITKNEWTRSTVCFNTGDRTEIPLRIANGGNLALTKGTAYIRDIYLEEIKSDNQWNVLALIYKNVKTPNFQASFSDADIKGMQSVIKLFPDTMQRLSDQRVTFGELDIKIINKPIQSISGDNANLTYGPGEDIDFDNYLAGNDYDLVMVFAPISKAPGNNNWYGLGGGGYWFNGKHILEIIVNDTMPDKRYWKDENGASYPLAPSVLIHEMLHGVETNSRMRGISDFEELHDGEKNGYENNNDEWFRWYRDLMTNHIKTGKSGFQPGSFIVSHYPTYLQNPNEALISPWALEEVEKARNAGLITKLIGEKMTENISRLQFAELIVNLVEKTSGTAIAPADPSIFSDCTNEVALKAYAAGIVNGMGDGTFKPDEKTNREQISAMIYRAVNYLSSSGNKIELSEPKPLTSYVDSVNVSDWAKEAVGVLVAEGIMKGTSENTLSPKAPCTIEQCVLLIYRLHQRY